MSSSSQPNKKRKSYVEDLLCAISRALPVDPVTAEDGRVYEREDIETYFQTHEDDLQVKSPVAGTMMGKRLYPAPQHRSMIESMIENSDITGKLAQEWKEKMAKQEQEKEQMRKAENGDVKAMEALALKVCPLLEAHKADRPKCYKWSKMAHEAQSVPGTAMLGLCLIGGEWDRQNEQKGSHYLFSAAYRGSTTAAFVLGIMLEQGASGFDIDLFEARRMFKLALKNYQERKDGLDSLCLPRLTNRSVEDKKHIKSVLATLGLICEDG